MATFYLLKYFTFGMSFNVALALCSEDPKMTKNEAVKASVLTTALKHCILFLF